MADPAPTPPDYQQEGHVSGWFAGNSRQFTGHTPNPYSGAAAEQWAAGYRQGFQAGEADHLDRMQECGRP